MNEKIYCSQCHNSVFRANSDEFYKTRFADGRKVCLYCYAHKKYYPADRLIGSCRSVEPEDKQKLLRQFWNANVACRTEPQ